MFESPNFDKRHENLRVYTNINNASTSSMIWSNANIHLLQRRVFQVKIFQR